MVALAVGSPSSHGQPVQFTPDEVARILSHGPWPPKLVRDPSNRASGNAEAIAFGERLFFDTRLSSNGLVSCARCHQPGKFFTDGHARSIGLAPGDRNAPTIVDFPVDAGSGGTGRTTASGRRASALCSMRAKWA